MIQNLQISTRFGALATGQGGHAGAPAMEKVGHGSISNSEILVSHLDFHICYHY